MKTLLKLIIPMMILSSCAGLSKKFDEARAKNVKKVAIVAMEIQQYKPTDNLGLGQLHTLKEGRDGDSTEMQTMAKNVITQFSSKLQNKTGWQILSLEQMMKNLAYKNKVTSAMNGARSVLVADKKIESIYLKETLDLMAFRKMSLDERNDLAKALGVDAVAELLILNEIDQSRFSLGHLTGNADFAYIGRANLQVYSPGSEDPIWRNQNVEGVKTKNSDELPKSMSKLEKLSKLGEEASTSAATKLVNEYPL